MRSFYQVHGSIHLKLWGRRDAKVIDMYFQEYSVLTTFQQLYVASGL